jgi:hypothetical protein
VTACSSSYALLRHIFKSTNSNEPSIAHPKDHGNTFSARFVTSKILTVNACVGPLRKLARSRNTLFLFCRHRGGCPHLSQPKRYSVRRKTSEVPLRSHSRLYVPAFDGIRAVAILPVVCLHVGAASLPDGNLLFQLSRGWCGVDLFFVLSGFLITWILDAEIAATGTIDLKHFYRRRTSRLAPAYISMLAALLVGVAVFQRSELSAVPRVAPWLLTYTYNYHAALGHPHFHSRDRRHREPDLFRH